MADEDEKSALTIHIHSELFTRRPFNRWACLIRSTAYRVDAPDMTRSEPYYFILGGIVLF